MDQYHWKEVVSSVVPQKDFGTIERFKLEPFDLRNGNTLNVLLHYNRPIYELVNINISYTIHNYFLLFFQMNMYPFYGSKPVRSREETLSL